MGEPANELVVLIDDGEPLVVGGRECLDGVLERIRGGEAGHVVGEGPSARASAHPVAERSLDVAGGDDAGKRSVVSDDG